LRLRDSSERVRSRGWSSLNSQELSLKEKKLRVRGGYRHIKGSASVADSEDYTGVARRAVVKETQEAPRKWLKSLGYGQ
jgi:hypothetical protein